MVAKVEKRRGFYEDLKHINETMSWPLHPILPMKKIPTKNISDDVGVILDDYWNFMDEMKPIVYLINMCDIKNIEQILNSEKKEYRTFEELLEEWMID